MLTSLRFKNWRSLRDVEINDLTPITVFVGANSSGKTNIFDGLHFLRYALDKDPTEAAYTWHGSHNIRTANVPLSEPTVIRFDMLETDGSGPFYHFVRFEYDEDVSHPASGENVSAPDPSGKSDAFFTSSKRLVNRWQMLDEDFLPPSRAVALDPIDLRIIDRKARNVPFMLDYMRHYRPEVFAKLLEDLSWLLEHVDKLNTTTDERETRFSIYEKLLPEIEAPTISGGTSRAVAMLTAMHALNAFDPELPGLVAIEEPDTAIHPLLLDSLVELFRVYVDVDENGAYEGDGTNRRQIFLTTHNPRLLDEFQPHEVRLVERDEKGFTVVKPVPLDIAKIWLEKYGLGEAWATRTLGGVPD